MSSHPDADAFMRGYLRNPPDATTRLVFADWLEETGQPWNAAWAYYIRLKAEADRYPFGSHEWKELEEQASGYAPKIRARLTIPAKRFVGYPRSLLQLLPASNITVKLADFEIPQALLELMPESVARENVVLPLDLQGRVLLVVAADLDMPNPDWNHDRLEKLEFILNRTVVAVRGDADEIRDVMNLRYGQTETETVDSVLYIFPIEFDIRPGAPAGYGDEPQAVVQLVNTILRDARSRGADRVLISPLRGILMQFRVGGEWSHPERFPGRLRDAADRVARMVDDRYVFNQLGRATGRFICRLGP
ncbi:MAG TPA: TIGR02996 domain-containing protein, partial [Gemmataceae bacterium]|nr:TIGR02996 domain-containing protein [Gemmataceae bacterium]